jgi:hypothetical protein
MFTPHKKREFGAGRLTEDQSNLVRERLDLIGLPSSPPMLKLVDHLADDRVDAPLRERSMAECRRCSLKRDIQGRALKTPTTGSRRAINRSLRAVA